MYYIFTIIYMSRYYDCIYTSRIYIFFGYLDFGIEFESWWVLVGEKRHLTTRDPWTESTKVAALNLRLEDVFARLNEANGRFISMTCGAGC